MKHPIFIISLLALAITSCSTTTNKNHWSSGIPAKQFFIDYHNKDPEHQAVLKQQDYLLWVHRFYFGWELYRRGWIKATDELTTSLQRNEDQQKAKQLMFHIGTLVAPEWAKNKNFRLINTRHLSIWGNTLNTSVVKKEQLLILSRIKTDAELLLNQQISPQSITADRYYPQKAFDIADNF